MSDVILEEEKVDVVKFKKLDYFNEVNRFYDVLLRLYEDEIKGEKTVLSEEDINVLANSSVYARTLAISAISSLNHIYEKIKIIIENKKDRSDFVTEYTKLLEDLSPTSRDTLAKFYNYNPTTNINETVDNIVADLRNTFAHHGYDLGYVVSGERVKGDEKSHFTDLTNEDAISAQDALAISRISMGCRKK